MRDLILADPNGNEVRAILNAEIDMEIGGDHSADDNTFAITVSRIGFEDDIPDKSRIFSPGTEFGGLVRRIKTVTEQNTITLGGYTWRGLLNKKIIQPASGQDYATATGELNAVLWGMVEPEFDGLFVASQEDTGVNVSNYKFDRYCTLLDGLTKMLKSVGYRLHMEYKQGERGDAGYVEISAVPIVNYSERLELSGDMRLNFIAKRINDGVNHLICLGDGELKDREVIHLYVQADGTIGKTQYYTGIDEIADVYDFPGAEADVLEEYALETFPSLMSTQSFEMDLESLNVDAEIGDIVGGRDYITGILMQKPITGKVWTYKNQREKIEYMIEGE